MGSNSSSGGGAGRDGRGRDSGTMTVGGHTFSKSDSASESGRTLVEVDASKLSAALGSQMSNLTPGRLEGVARFIAGNPKTAIHAPVVSMNGKGKNRSVGITDGRNRLTHFANRGGRIAISVPKRQAGYFARFQ